MSGSKSDEGSKGKEQLHFFILINKLLNLHYKNLVGLVPLSKTIHELVHSSNENGIIIPIESVFGNTNEFIKLYKESIPDITISKYNERLKLSNTETDYDLLKK